MRKETSCPRISLTGIIVVALFTAVLTSCSRHSEVDGGGQFTRNTIEHDGLEREYFVYLPQDYDSGAEYPVVFFLHGYGGTATGTEAETTNGLNRYAEEYGFIMVYPQGTWFMSDGSPEERWEVSTWNHVSGGFDEGPEGPLCTADATDFPCPPECGDCGQCGWTSCHDDVGFLEKLFATVAKDLSSDTGRFYISGFSGGSMMAHYLGCIKSDRFAAVALVGGRLERGYQCSPTEPIPILQINGALDKTVPSLGTVSGRGYFYASSKATADAWNKGTGCEAEPRPWATSITKAHGVQCLASCTASNRESIDCLWLEGEHYWPGYPPGHGSYGYCVTAKQQSSMPEQTLCVEPNTDVDVWGSRLVFDFFQAHIRASEN